MIISLIKTVKYEVVAEFPGSLHKMGDLVYVYEINGMAEVVEVNGHSLKVDIRKFPKIYQLVKD